MRSRKLRKILLCLGMEGAALFGAPIRPEDVEDLLRNGKLAKVESTVQREREDPDTLVPGEPEDVENAPESVASGRRYSSPQ